jgi:hypothetical protein
MVSSDDAGRKRRVGNRALSARPPVLARRDSDEAAVKALRAGFSGSQLNLRMIALKPPCPLRLPWEEWTRSGFLY